MIRALLTTTLLAVATVATAFGGTINLIANGTFETGNLNGWIVSSTSSGNVTSSCNLSFGAQAVAQGCIAGTNPNSGSYAAYASTSFPAIANSTGSWTDTLSQNFTVGSGTNISNAVLSYSYSLTDSGTGAIRGVLVQVRVLSGSTVLATQTILQNPTVSGSVPWTNKTFNLTSVLSANEGQQLTLQLSSTAFYRTNATPRTNSTALITGFDNVKLNLTQPVPEPPTVMLMGSVLLLGWFWRNRSRFHQAPKITEACGTNGV